MSTISRILQLLSEIGLGVPVAGEPICEELDIDMATLQTTVIEMQQRGWVRALQDGYGVKSVEITPRGEHEGLAPRGFNVQIHDGITQIGDGNVQLSPLVGEDDEQDDDTFDDDEDEQENDALDEDEPADDICLEGEEEE